MVGERISNFCSVTLGLCQDYLCVFDRSLPISASKIPVSAWCPVKGEETSSRLVGNTRGCELAGNSWQCQRWQQFLIHLSRLRNVAPCSQLPSKMGLINFFKLAANPHSNLVSHSCTQYQQRWGGAQQQLRGWVRKGWGWKQPHVGYALRWQVNKATFLGVSVPLLIKLWISRASEETVQLGMWHEPVCVRSKDLTKKWGMGSIPCSSQTVTFSFAPSSRIGEHQSCFYP